MNSSVLCAKTVSGVFEISPVLHFVKEWVNLRVYIMLKGYVYRKYLWTIG